MRQYANSTADTLVTFHVGRGGRFNNPGYLYYVDQDKSIDSYTENLFVAFENEYSISKKIGNRANLRDLFDKVIDNRDNGDSQYKERFERLTGLEFGNLIYVQSSDCPVGLDFDNDGTGTINIDNEYDTTYVQRLKDCSTNELKLIYESTNWVSEDVRDYCKEILIEIGEIEEEEEEEEI